jgi:hypothetical protein
VDVAERLAALTAADLAPVVRRAVRSDGAWPTDWSFERLSWTVVNPSTVGLYRVEGTARMPSGLEVPWQVVLKVVSDVPVFPWLTSGYMREPRDWNYWKREALVYRSEVLSGFTDPFAPVRCLGVDELASDQVWIWMEALAGAAPRARWSIDELARSAHDLGAFSAQGVQLVERVGAFPWAARHWLRGWVTTIRELGAQHAADHADCWMSPQLGGAITASTGKRFAGLMSEADDLLMVVESLPVTVAHHDAQWTNLFQQRPGGRVGGTVAIDWSFLGLAPVGQDLGHHVGLNIFNWAIDPYDAASHDATATRAYLRGLHDFGWDGDERTVTMARAAAAALQAGTFYAAHVSWLCPDMMAEDDEDEAPWPEELLKNTGLAFSEVMARWDAGFNYVLDMGDEARRLAAELT